VIVETNVAVPMRDGVVLRADVYRPASDGPHPAVLNRTPYNRSLRVTPPAALDPELALAAGLALVCQDVRGQYSSEGEFYPFRSEEADGFDSVEWVAAQPWCDGKVVMAGRSYSAATQWLAAAARPPHLEAIFPVVTGSDYYNGWIYQGGAFQLGFNLFWVQLMTAPKARGSLAEQFRHLPITDPPLLEASPAGRFYRDWLAHPNDDHYWQALAINRRYGQIEVPAYNVGGWYDLFLSGTLENYRRMRAEAATERARLQTRLLIGPWAHGSTYGAYPDHGFAEFGNEARVDLAQLQTAFYREQLLGPAEEPAMPVRIFVMGDNRWRDERDWPLSRAREQRLFLHGGGVLSTDAPGAQAPDTYVYDPADPAPTIGGPTSLPARFLRTNSGPLDQRPLETRSDVLVYSSAPLARPLEVTGPLSLVLHAASSAPDTDFVAKLCDVAPDGVSRIVAEGVLRTRFADDRERPRLREPNRAYEYAIDLVATSNTFLAGHRIRLLVTSSSFPRFDRNTNTGHALGADGPQDLQEARQTIFHDDGRASHLRLPIVER
jgi:putative CocE/NonD family hydrolase